ncbi:MAG: IS1 family transposase [Flavobacterium sp.]|uniref:IS1 family transposase n=1 Tax=Flavobacterium sp. TaxID=239 RepID=UPI003263E028
MKKAYCPHCSGTAVKNGFQLEVQRYRCKLCRKKFQISYTYQAYKKNTNDSIVVLLKEGCGIRSISRILKISTNIVLSRIVHIGNNLEPKPLYQKGCSYEMDEMWTFIGNKSNVVWITYAIERKSKQVVDFILGSKTKENIQPLVNKLILLEPKRVYTDGLNLFPALIPKDIHRRFQYCTNIIERNNLTIRTHLKRLSRKTICFSRSLVVLNCVLKIYFWL